MNENTLMLERLQEHLQYQTSDFPLAIFYDRFDFFVNHSFECHWHDEIELALVLSGSVDYLVNQTHYQLERGSGLFIGPIALHSARQLTGGSVVFNIIFPNRILSNLFNSSTLYKQVSPRPLWTDRACLLDPDDPSHAQILHGLAEIEASTHAETSRELIQAESIMHMWRYFSDLFKNEPDVSLEPKFSVRETRMRNMISYIHANYMYHISASSIAASANISRSECFRCFSLFGEGSPIDYLNKYRLHIAIKNLLETDLSVSDISHACGFSSTSYFSKTFKDTYGVSPLSYRKKGSGPV